MAQSTITIEELAARLDLIPIAGESGLGNEISWAHASELEDPTPWLFGGELLMSTGMGVPVGETEQLNYLQRLASHGLSGLVVADDLGVPPIHATVRETADRLAFPVLRAHLGIPFITIAQEVASVVQRLSSARVKAQLDVFGAIRLLATERLSAAEFVQRLARISRCRLFVCGPSGRPLLPGVEVPPSDLREHVPQRSEIGPPTVPGGFIVPIPGVDWMAGYLLAIATPDDPNVDLAVAQHIATAIGLKMADMRYELEVKRREHSELLSALLDGAVDATAAARSLSKAGFPANARLRLLRITDSSGAAGEGDPSLANEWSEPVLLLNRGRERWALVLDDPAVWAASTEDSGVSIGVSGPIEATGSLRIARQEAEWACARAEELGGVVVVYGEDPIGRWLNTDHDVVSAMVEHVLGGIRRYDATTGSSLVDTLRVWLDSGRRLQETAKALHVHDNTVAYRLKRFESLTGRDLSRTADIAEIWLALRALTQLPNSPR